MWFWYSLLALTILFSLLLLMRLRLRVVLSNERRAVFVGLGRSGPEFDFAGGTAVVRLAGIRMYSFPLQRTKKSEPAVAEPEQPASVAQKIPPGRQTTTAAEDRPEAEPEETSIPFGERVGRLIEQLSLVPRILGDLWWYARGLFRSIIVEQFEADIYGGFARPDLTGMAYGWYHAVLGAAPARFSHIRFTPDFQQARFSGSMRASVALPVYQLVGRTVILLWRLPIREIIRVIRESRKGA